MFACDVAGCGAVQHAACSMQNDTKARHWRCDGCWLAAGERPVEGSRRVTSSSSGRGGGQAEKATADRQRMSTAHRLGWVAGAKVLDACGVEHIIQAMKHGYVQCSRPGEAGLRNYRRRELQLLLGASDDEESRSSASEKDDVGPLSTDASDLEDGSEDVGMAAEGPCQDSSDEL